MTIDTQNIESSTENWSVPRWVKLIITFFSLNIVIVFILLGTSGQRTFFGLPAQVITLFSLGPVIVAVGLLVAFWFFPGASLTRSLYGLLRIFRIQICILALLGMLVLITIRVPILSLRGGVPFLNLVLLFLAAWFVPPIRADRLPVLWMQRLYLWAKDLTHKVNALPTLPLSIVVSLLPVVVICLVIYLGLDARLSDYGPYSFWNDETGYWVWTRSFGYAGFNAGYSTPNELPAPASFNHYGEGSPIYLYLYGGIAQVVGWVPYLPILINFVLLSVAIFFFAQVTQLKPVQLIFTSLITILTWPILLYLPMTTHETLNQAIGFFLALIFLYLLNPRNQISPAVRIVLVVLVYFASLVRLSWGLLLIPAVFYTLRGSVFRRVLLSVVLGLGFYVSALMITNFLVPPANNSILVNMRQSLDQGPRILFDYVSFQFSQMFKSKQLNPNIAVMFQIFIILCWNLVRVLRSIRSKNSVSSILESRSVFEIYTVFTLAVAGLLFYIQEGFYRTFTPSLLLVYLLQTVKKDYKFLATLLTINLLFFHSYMTFYGKVGDFAIIRQDFTTDFSEHAKLQPAVEKWIRFEPDAQTPWCNTLLIPLHYYDGRLTLIPPGIGISYIQDLDTLKTPLKSKYLLLDPQTYHELSDRINTELLESYFIGDLYYNLDSGCELKK